MLFVVCYIFQIIFSKKIFRSTISVKGFGSYQAQNFVWLGLGPNCLQRLSADDNSRLELNIRYTFLLCHLNILQEKINITDAVNVLKF